MSSTYAGVDMGSGWWEEGLCERACAGKAAEELGLDDALAVCYAVHEQQ